LISIPKIDIADCSQDRYHIRIRREYGKQLSDGLEGCCTKFCHLMIWDKAIRACYSALFTLLDTTVQLIQGGLYVSREQAIWIAICTVMHMGRIG